jgi:hypothetical protein
VERGGVERGVEGVAGDGGVPALALCMAACLQQEHVLPVVALKPMDVCVCVCVCVVL